MNKNILQVYFFMGLLLAVSVLMIFLFLPFVEVLILSAIFAVVLTPIHQKISKKIGGREGLSAFIVIILFAIIFMVPLSLLTVQVLGESRELYSQITDNSDVNYIQKITALIEGPIQRIYPSFTLDIGGFAGFAVDWITSRLSNILSSVFSIVTGIFLVFISLFFFIRDGKKFKDLLIDLSPLNDKYDEQIFTKVKHTITATVKGVILVAIVQGVLSGIGMLIFGVPNYTLWGSISAVASLVPGLGTAIVFLPAISYMFIIGNTASAIGLIIWGTLVVGLVDNFLTPYLYSRGVEVHPLIMLFAVLGGLIVFGPIGFLFGPIIIALFFSLIDIYRNIILKNESL